MEDKKIDPLSQTHKFLEETLANFDKRFSIHQDILAAMGSLLMKKSQYDKQYSEAHKFLCDEFDKLAEHAQDEEVQHIITALSRNFGNLSCHLEQMSFDLKNDVNHDFKSNQEETKELIRSLKKNMRHSIQQVAACRKATIYKRNTYVKALGKIGGGDSGSGDQGVVE